MSDLTSLSHILNTSPDALARELWINSFYSLYIDNIWDNVEVWRYISMFSILLLIFYKKKIRFFSTKEEKVENARSVFINSDLVMTEAFLKEFLIELSINETFHKSRYEKVKEFCDYFKREENKYIDNIIQDSINNFCLTMADLKKFLGEHFFEIHIPGAYRLYPDLKNDPDFDYAGFQEQLYKLCKDAEILYLSYRLNVKTKLSI